MPDRVYLDWNATTPLRREAKEAMASAWDLVGNPSSVHAEGRQARRLMLVTWSFNQASNAARTASRADGRGGSGEKAGKAALSPGLRTSSGQAAERLLVSAIEHASVLTGGRFAGGSIATVGVTRYGVLDLDGLAAALEGGPPALVSVMLANNETGAVQPVEQAAEMVHAAGGMLHVDAIQAFGKMPFNLKSLGADLITLSAHKIGGPKGIGAVILADGVQGLAPLLRGGGQELGHRAGTENVAAIAGFGAAVEAATGALDSYAGRLETLQNRLEKGLRQTPGLVIFADKVTRVPNTTLFTVPGLKAETAVIGFDLAGIAVSSGSACSSGKVQRSYVLDAMGFGAEFANGAVRLSMGWSTTDADIDRCLEAWRKLAGTLLNSERRNTA